MAPALSGSVCSRKISAFGCRDFQGSEDAALIIKHLLCMCLSCCRYATQPLLSRLSSDKHFRPGWLHIPCSPLCPSPEEQHSRPWVLGGRGQVWSPFRANNSFSDSTCSLDGAAKPIASAVAHTRPNSFAEPQQQTVVHCQPVLAHALPPGLSKQLPPPSCNQESIKTTSKLISETLLQASVTSC